jgi:hypothetical protein
MGAAKQRICTTCGAEEFTASRSKVCSDCYNEARRLVKRREEKEYIEALGYTGVQYIGFNIHLKPEWQFSHECGALQVWTFSNLLKRRKEDPDTIPCSACGGNRRTRNGTAVSAENRRIKNPEGWPDYLYVVRRMTEETYLKHKDEINPGNIQRSRQWHLDHIISIAEGYETGLAPEFIARKENLQILTSFENLSKGRK